jgi:Flp pilus assembly protein TadG
MGKHFKRNDRGGAAVEMALLMPVLLMVLFATVDFGRMYNAQITLTEAAKDGARAAVLGANATTETREAAPDLSGVTVAVTSCPASPTNSSDAIVIASYPFEFITPLSALTALFGGTAVDGSFSLTARGQMSCL